MRVKRTVEKLVFGGKGLIRHEGKVLFVPDVAEGEEVEAEIREEKKSYAKASLLTILKASSKRVTPKCPYFGTCGGCQLQHLLYEEQLVQMEKWLKESLERIGKISIDCPIQVHPNRTPYGYRHKIILHARMRDGKMHLGYYSRDMSVFNVRTCPIFIDGPCDLFEKLLEFFHKKLHQFEADVRILREQKGALFVHCFFPKGIPPGADALLQIGYPVLLEDHKRSRGADPTFELEVEGLFCSYSPRVFIQNDPLAFTTVYRAILQKIEPKSTCLELYSGVGIFSLLGAHFGHEMVGVELALEAVQLAQKSAQKNGLEKVQFFAESAEKADLHVKIEEYPTWVVNPPRTGLSDEMKEKMVRTMPETIFYISCDPSTLARDLHTLCNKYRIESLDLYDMFSQTTHFENVVCLRRL